MSNRSVERVKEAAAKLELCIDVFEMDISTRTAEDAANACGCDVSQIVKSLVFERQDSKQLVLLLISGDQSADLDLASQVVGSKLARADPKKVRKVTGFAIGGVSSLGHLSPIETFIDPSLLTHNVVWIAAGAPNAVFSIDPQNLKSTTNAKLLKK